MNLGISHKLSRNEVLPVTAAADRLISKCPRIKPILAEFLRDELQSNRVPAEDWYHRPGKWVDTRTQPHPYRTEYDEQLVLQANEESISDLLRHSAKVFLGVGVGDTELQIVEWDLSFGRTEIVAVDIYVEFLRRFADAIRSAADSVGSTEAYFRGLQRPFQRLEPDELQPNNLEYRRRTFLCLGNTVGNWPNQDEFFSIVEGLMLPGDLFVLGYHKLNGAKEALDAYVSNKPLKEIVEESARRAASKVGVPCATPAWTFGTLPWNEKYKAVLATCEPPGIVAFFSVKYAPGQITDLAARHGLLELAEPFSAPRSSSVVSVFEKK